MKLHSDRQAGRLRISAYDGVSVTVGERRLTGTFAITPERLVPDIRVGGVEDLRWTELDMLDASDLEIIILGTGDRQRFPGRALYAELAAARVGLEVMDSAAACRTHNILAGEGRRVAAVIIVGSGRD